jgi:hypothetical protein
MLSRTLALLSLAGLFGAAALSQYPYPAIAQTESSPPQEKPAPHHQDAQSEQRGSEQTPPVVKILPAPQTNEKPTDGAAQHPEKAPQDWTTGDIIAGIAAIAAILQAIALIWTILILMRTAQRQLRAYVTHEIKAWRGINDGKPLATQIALMAHGETPARAVRVIGIIDIMPFPLPTGYQLPELWTEFPQSTNVFPGETNNPAVGLITAKRPFTDAEIVEITSETSKRRAYMLGHIYYRDVFNKRRETTFRAFLEPRLNLSSEMLAAKSLHSFGPPPKKETISDECPLVAAIPMDIADASSPG